MPDEPIKKIGSLSFPEGTEIVACPECGSSQSHAGTCRFSVQRSGKIYLVIAVPLPSQVLEAAGHTPS